MAKSAPTIEAVGEPSKEDGLAPTRLLSGDLIIGLIGYAGAGCTDVYKRLNTFLTENGFEAHQVKLSRWIAQCSKQLIEEVDEGMYT